MQLSTLGGTREKLYCRKSPHPYYICPDIGLIYLKPLPTVAEMSAYAEEQYSAGLYKAYAAAGNLKKETFERRVKILKSLNAGPRLLDVGCACGFFIEVALKHGFDAHGVEFSREAVAQARQDVQKRITVGDVNEIFRSGAEKFDVVVAFDIIEHTQDPLEFLLDIRRILNPGGIIMVATPDTDHFLRYLMRSHWPMLQPLQHTYLFSRKAMAKALDAAGYDNVQIRNADKTLSIDYLLDQIRIYNPLLNKTYRVVSPLIPRGIRAKPRAINIGEMLAIGRRKES